MAADTVVDLPAVAATRRETTRAQVRGSSLLLGGRVLSLGVNFAAQVLIVRYLSKADFGAFAYALSIVALAQTVLTFGLDRAVTRFVPIYEERGEYGKIFGTLALVVGTVLSLGVATVLLVWGLAGLAGGSFLGAEHAVTLLLILIVLAPIQALDGVQTGMFAVVSKPRAIFFRKYVLAPGLRLVVVLLLVLAGAGVSFLAAGYVVAGAVGVAIYSVILFRELRVQGLLARFDRATFELPWRELFVFTIPLLSSDLVYAAMHTSDAIMLGHFGGADDVASFRAIWPAAHLNQIVLASFALLFTPAAARLFARQDRRGINDLYWGTAIWTAVLTFPVFALTFSLADPLTVTLYGERYEGSGIYLTLLAVGYYFQAAVGFNGLTLKVVGLLRIIVTINIAAAVLNVALNLVLIPRYGALGAAIGTAGALVAHNLLKQAALRRAGVEVFARQYVKVYGVIALAALALLGVQSAFSPSLGVGLVLAALAALAVLVASRRSLQLAETFPELARFRPLRLLLSK